MGRSGKTGHDFTTNYFGLSNRKKRLLTVEFLEDLKNEIIKRCREEDVTRVFMMKIMRKKLIYLYIGKFQEQCYFMML